ncbi:MAG: hypothetical protein KAR47_02075 [Planctomycetes bacterium]|nr:hypothetical protein [Planctomycetota bacterium]
MIRKTRMLIPVIFALAIALGVDVAEARDHVVQAYLDPGTGSLIIQVLLASLVGMGFAMKMFWAHIAAFFSKFFAGKQSDDKQ